MCSLGDTYQITMCRFFFNAALSRSLSIGVNSHLNMGSGTRLRLNCLVSVCWDEHCVQDVAYQIGCVQVWTFWLYLQPVPPRIKVSRESCLVLFDSLPSTLPPPFSLIPNVHLNEILSMLFFFIGKYSTLGNNVFFTPVFCPSSQNNSSLKVE